MIEKLKYCEIHGLHACSNSLHLTTEMKLLFDKQNELVNAYNELEKQIKQELLNPFA